MVKTFTKSKKVHRTIKNLDDLLFIDVAHKRFNKEVFDAVDAKSRRIVIEYMKQLGYEFKNGSKYSIDLFSAFTPKIALELEHRDCFVNDWPYPSVHIPGRKAKFLINKHVHYIVVSRNFDRIGICLGNEILKHPRLREIKNTRNKDGEYFYEIPKDKFKWLTICT